MSTWRNHQAKFRSPPKSGWLNNPSSFALISSVIQIMCLYVYVLAHLACYVGTFLSLMSLRSCKPSVCVPSLVVGIFMLKYLTLAPEATSGHCPLCSPHRGGVPLPPKNSTLAETCHGLCVLLPFACANAIISPYAYGMCQLFQN